MKRKTRRLTKESISDFGDIDTLQAIHDRKMDSMIGDGVEEKNFLGIRGLNKGTYSDGEEFLQWKDKEIPYEDFEAEIQERFPESEGDFEAWIHDPKNKGKIKSILPELDWVFNDEDNYWESTKKFGKKFNEGVHPHDAEEDVPVTEQEELLCQYIPGEIEEFCRNNGLEVSCYCSEHQTGEEQHIEIYVGIPEGDDPTDPKYDNIEENLEMLVNGIGDAENEGEKWGDASFQWISDEEIFGELWPLEGELAGESSVNDYDTQDYGDENYGEPDEFDVKARELNDEWEELGTKTKNEYCESLWYVLGNWIATDRVDEKTVKAMLWEAVSGYDGTDVYEVIEKMVENGKNSTLARRKSK